MCEAWKLAETHENVVCHGEVIEPLSRYTGLLLPITLAEPLERSRGSGVALTVIEGGIELMFAEQPCRVREGQIAGGQVGFQPFVLMNSVPRYKYITCCREDALLLDSLPIYSPHVPFRQQQPCLKASAP
jgi:hypothetical protein